jgi:pyruvate ferredoxin oxidoreductase alpha subunit
MDGAGPLFLEICAALFAAGSQTKMVDYIYGLGGRDIFPEHFEKVASDLQEVADSGKVRSLVSYLGLRE